MLPGSRMHGWGDEMQFLHKEFSGGSDCTVVVSVTGQANVLLLDDAAFLAYRRGASFRYVGGWVTRSPVRLAPPHLGHWHVIVDLGGHDEGVRASVNVLRKTGQMKLW